MKLCFYTADYTAKIIREISTKFDNYQSYRKGRLSGHLGYLDAEINESTLEIKSIPSLNISHASPEFDAQASILIHKAFRLPRTVAKDRRLGFTFPTSITQSIFIEDGDFQIKARRFSKKGLDLIQGWQVYLVMVWPVCGGLQS